MSLPLSRWTYPITLPIGSETPMATLHHPTSIVWEFEMHNGTDNRLSSAFLTHCLAKALDIVENDWRAGNADEPGGPGALIISGKHDQEKFFSNGGDFASVAADPSFFATTFNPPLSHLLTFPIPTIAAINGHAFAAGFVLSLACDYRVMQTSRGWCSMNEVLFGAPLPYPFAAVLNYKLPSPKLAQEASLNARRFSAKELYDLGVIDVLAENGPGVLKAARELAIQRAGLAKTGAWGLMKKDLMREPLAIINTNFLQMLPSQDANYARGRL